MPFDISQSVNQSINQEMFNMWIKNRQEASLVYHGYEQFQRRYLHIKYFIQTWNLEVTHEANCRLITKQIT